MDKPRNWVKKHSDLLLKPSRMKDRKKEAKKQGDYGGEDRLRPRHAPYKRVPQRDVYDTEDTNGNDD